MSEELFRMSRRLIILDSIVQELFKANKPSDILKKKINELESKIMDIDDDKYESPATMWRLKLASYWKRFSELLPQSQSPIQTKLVVVVKPKYILRPMSPPINNYFQEPSTLQPVERISDKNLDYKMNFNLQPMVNKPYNDGLSEVQKKEIKLACLEKEIASLDMINDLLDVYAIKKLISKVANMFELVPPELEDKQLQSRVFNLVLGKLSQNVSELFLLQHHEESLYQLFNFLRLELESYTDNQKLQQPNTGWSLNKLDYMEKASRDQMGNQVSNCKYCQQMDHTIKYCPKVELGFCMNCFQLGHTENWCKNKSLFKRE